MASAIGTALIYTFLPPMAAKAKNFIKNEGKGIFRSMADKAMDNIERDISRLQTTLYMFDGIVRVAELKQIDEQGNPRVSIQNWLRDLVDIGYEARDVLDDFITFSSCTITAEEASNPVNTICSLMLSCFGILSSHTSNIPLAVLNRLEKDIRSVRERFDEKYKEAFATLKSESVKNKQRDGPFLGREEMKQLILRLCDDRVDVDVVGEGSENRRPEVGPFINKQRDGLFLGREEMKQEIVEKILRLSDDRFDVDVIYGMETTLAQSIYNDERVKKVPRKWLCVESIFCAEKVIKEIIGDSSTDDVKSLQKKLVEKFEGNRFLIVLDDVWDVQVNQWNSLFDPLTHVGKGGLIIVTRGEKEVYPALINIQMAYKLQPLSEKILYLKCIGEDIVEKLNGHPLLLKVVGRSLLNKDNSTLTDFLEFKFPKDDEVMSALRWSYNHLPRHLKTCFTYCALFPKDHVFDNEKVLVEMWMAHDLIEKEEQERPEDVGAQYFEELVNASLLECVDGKYVMHDLILVLALLVSNEEFANSSLTNDKMEMVRHITITPGDYSKIPRLCKMEKLLTLYTTDMLYTIDDETDDEIYPTKKYVLDVFNQLESIRVLVLDSSKIIDIPDCISKLKHLRYLDVSRTRVQSLPDSLCHLYNLQMLATPPYTVLPRDIVNMVNLRYVRAKLATCKGVGKLTSLQELSSIHVCEGDNIRELGDMQILRGELKIEGLENVSTLEGDPGALMEKQILMDTLELNFDEQLEKSTISEKVLDSLGCPPNLTYLKISGYTGVKSPSWMVDRKHKFDKLHTLELSHCPKLESLPPLGELTSLKHLSLQSVGVKRLGDEFYGKFTDGKVFFPSLESLRFYKMQEWEEWDDIIIENSDVSFFPRLTILEIEDCAKLVSVLPVVENPIMNAANFMTSLSHLEIHNFNGLKRLQLDALVSLKELEISNCSSLVQITSAICEWLEIKSKLQTLKLYDCPKLESLPLLGELTSLSRLKICDCDGLKRLQLDALVSLKELEITRCSSLVQITSAICERLQISSCRLLEKMDVARCDSLVVIKILKLENCESLRSLSIDIHGMDSLEQLNITGCPKLELAFEDGSSSSSSSGNSVAVPIHNIFTDNTQVFRTLLHHELISLESLQIINLGGFENFDETEANNFCKLRSLKRLCISKCEDLSSLSTDFHKLSSLEKLSIYNCPQLQSLPADGLPPSLSDLCITGCPLLYERCKDESGLDWHKINHIPERKIRLEDE